MIFVTIIVFLAILLVYADDRRLIKGGYWISFWILTVTMSLRYGYGNDYFSYMRYFYEIISYPSFQNAYNNSGMEFGWVVLSRILAPFGFQSQIFLSSVILYLIFYILINKYVPRPYRWLGLMIFLLSDGMFLLNLSMIRQGLSSALVFWAIILSLEDKRLTSLLVLFIGVSIHTSALVGLPFLLLIFLRTVIKPKAVMCGCVLCCIGLFVNPSLSDSFFSILLGNDAFGEVYGKYMGRTSDNFSMGIGVIIQYVTILPGLFYFKYLKETDKYFVIFYLMVLLLIPLSSKAILLLRMVSYFLPFAVILFPRLYDKHQVSFERPLEGKNKFRFLTMSKVSLVLYLIYVSYSYYSFFSSETYGFAYKNFQFCF